MMICQRRQLKLGPLFDYELTAVPASLIDEQGCPRKGNKSALVKRLGVIECTRHAAVIENTSPAPITAIAVDTMAAAIPIQRKE